MRAPEISGLSDSSLYLSTHCTRKRIIDDRMRSSRRLVEAIDSSLSWTLSSSATAGPSRPRFLSTTSVTAAQARSAGGQSGKSRSAFGIKKLRDGDAQRVSYLNALCRARHEACHVFRAELIRQDDPNFGFGVSKSAAPRSTSRASSRPRRSDVSDIRVSLAGI